MVLAVPVKPSWKPSAVQSVVVLPTATGSRPAASPQVTPAQHRQHREVPSVAIVGYTNAGKSTLLNALTNAEVYTADQLFAA